MDGGGLTGYLRGAIGAYTKGLKVGVRAWKCSRLQVQDWADGGCGQLTDFQWVSNTEEIPHKIGFKGVASLSPNFDIVLQKQHCCLKLQPLLQIREAGTQKLLLLKHCSGRAF